MADKLHNLAQHDSGYRLVVGLGKTGLSIARFLAGHGLRFIVADSRAQAPGVGEFRKAFPGVELVLGEFPDELFEGAEQILLSPGVAPQVPAVTKAMAKGVEVIGDIELFARHAGAPVIAITGSNGKSTVTTLVGEMVAAAGLNVKVGGNLGTPALDLLGDPAVDVYVLELSSFQLEVTRSLNAVSATVLNISEDHLDRHGSVEHYAEIKQRIFNGDGLMVLNADDPLVVAMAETGRRQVCFTLGKPATEKDYGLLEVDGITHLAKGNQPLVAVNEIRIAGRHNWANALAALALLEPLNITREAYVDTLRRFPGLPHRCEWVAEIDGVNWYEDSKGTNVGATLAALSGMPGVKVVLIAGGQGKGQDFAPLKPVVEARARVVILFGEDADQIEEALQGAVAVIRVTSMEDAVASAAKQSLSGDCVLLSPACASFDMFDNYIARGEAFKTAVGRIAA